MDHSYQIERITHASPKSHFSQLALLHQDEIKQGFLSSLGPKFLQRLYQSLSCSPHAFIFIAIREGNILGFICGSTNTRKVYRDFFVTSGLRTMFTLFPKLVTRNRIQRVAETLLYPFQNRGPDLPSSEILNFCVDKNMQRIGIGKQLFERLTAEFCDRQVDCIRIVTGATQVSAQRFYESVSADKYTELEIHSGQQSFIYTYQIPNKGQLFSARAA